MKISRAKRSSVEPVAGARSATRVTVSVFGAIAGLAGIEHGIGEVLQGNVAPEEVAIQSWPDSQVFGLLNGEPAMTIVPNLLVTGILATLVSLAFLVWATVFVQRRHGGLVMILLSLAMLLVGGGFGPPILGVILGAAATRIGAPLKWWGAHLSGGSLRFLADLWPWTLVAGVIAWLSVVPGTVLLDFFFGAGEMDFIVPILAFTILSAFGLLLLTIVAGFARDIRRRTGPHRAPSMGERQEQDGLLPGG